MVWYFVALLPVEQQMIPSLAPQNYLLTFQRVHRFTLIYISGRRNRTAKCSRMGMVMVIQWILYVTVLCRISTDTSISDRIAPQARINRDRGQPFLTPCNRITSSSSDQKSYPMSSTSLLLQSHYLFKSSSTLRVTGPLCYRSFLPRRELMP